MKWEEAGDEGVATPGGYHVTVEEGAKGTVEDGAQFQGLDPKVEGVYEKENGDGLVIVGTGDRS
jgi:hypothetical protein